MWLKEEYGIYINLNNKAFIYSIQTKNDKLYSNEFKIVPFGIAAILKLLGNGWEINAVIAELVTKGMEIERAQKLVYNIINQYKYLFSEVPSKNKYDEKQINKLITQYGCIPFDYKNKRYNFPKNVILEITTDVENYMKLDVAEKIHINCYEGGTENIFYLGEYISQWSYLSMFLKENYNHHISSILNIDLSVNLYNLQKILECGIYRLQILCKCINKDFLVKIQIVLSLKITFDLYLLYNHLDILAKFTFNECKFLLRNIYISNASTKQIENIVRFLKNINIQAIILSGCKGTSFGQRSCFKSGIMNLIFTFEGEAVFCITGGRHIAFGNITTDSIDDIWNNFDTSIENRKKIFSMCSIK